MASGSIPIRDFGGRRDEAGALLSANNELLWVSAVAHDSKLELDEHLEVVR
jgi:predicted alpha/beta-hydrolase family hydrolase